MAMPEATITRLPRSKTKSWPKPAWKHGARVFRGRWGAQSGFTFAAAGPLALRHVEGDLLAFLERLVARALDRAVMREEILAAVIRRDEAETLRVVEPLYGTCSHVYSIPHSYATHSELRWRAR